MVAAEEFSIMDRWLRNVNPTSSATLGCWPLQSSYAMRFLEDHDFSNVVTWEVLNLIPPITVGDASEH